MFTQHFPNSHIVSIHDSSAEGKLLPFKVGDKVPEGHGVFFTPNGCVGRRLKENLSHVTSMFADFDFKSGVPELKQFLLDIDELPTATYIVRSKNGYHCYWRLTEPIVVTDENRDELIKTLEAIHRQMVVTYGADAKAADILHLLRIPGYEHRKDINNPFMVEIVSDDSDTTYTLEELTHAIPPLYEDAKPAYEPSPSDFDLRKVVVDVWKEKGSEASFNKMGQLIIDGVRTATFLGRKGSGGYIATTSTDYPYQGNATTYVAGVLGTSTSEAYKWLGYKYGFPEKEFPEKEFPEKEFPEKEVTVVPTVEEINNELALLGIDAIKTIDPCPERTAYIRHLAEAQWDDADWKKTLKALKLGSLLAYHRYISSLHPNLIYELGEDKTFWNYDFEEGVYIEMSFAEVRGIVISLLIADNMSEVATEGTAKNILNRYRAENLHRGVTLDRFADPEGWIHVNNGWLRLETSTLEPHSPEKRSLYKTVVDFNPEATCPLYDAYMDVDTKMPKDQTRVLDQYSGYILTTRIDQQKMLILEGGRGCGKSMLPEIWLEILGQKATIASLTSLTSGEIRFMGESFAHKNFCFFDEANPKTNNINEYFQNMVTKPYITIERKAIQKKVNVRNTLKMVLCLNEMPDHMPTGMSRRYRHIVFTHSFTDEAGDDTNYKNKIVTNELSGVLNRMLAGLKDINKMGGMTMMAGEAERIREHSLVSDDLSAFLEDHFEPSLDSIVRYSYSQVQNAFLAEYEQKGYYKQLSVRGFNKKLLANRLPEFRRIELAKTAGVRGYKGMKLKDGHKFDNNEKSTIKVLGMPDPDYF